MEKATIAEIAKKLNVSTSMAGRVLRHCNGVDSEMRHRILQEIGKRSVADYGECAVYAIFPDVPRYFWQPLQKGALDTLRGAGAAYKMNIYTQVGDEAAVLWYLEEAEALHAQVILLAAHVTPAIHRRLESLTKRRLILLLGEEHKLANTFYVGNNAYQDGFSMGRHYAAHYGDRPVLMLTLPGNFNAERRVEGFSAALQEEDPALLRNVVRIKLDQQIFKNLKLLPSKLASLLLDAAQPYERLCIYSPTGIPQFPLVTVKAKLTERAVCLCHDYYVRQNDQGSTSPVVMCNQDLLRQGIAAAELSVVFLQQGVYPDHKRMYIPSRIDSSFASAQQA